MPRQPDGTFQRYNSQYTGADVWQKDLDTDTQIIALRHDVHDEDLAQGIAACLPKDGTEQMQGVLNMGTFGIANLANAGTLEYSNAAAYGQTITEATFDDPSRQLTLTREGMLDLVVTIPSGGDNTTINNGVQTIHKGTGLKFLSGNNSMSEANPIDTILLTNTGVSAGSYTAANITIDAQGRITFATSGTSPTNDLSDTQGAVNTTIHITGGAGTVITAAVPTSEVGAQSGVMSAAQAEQLKNVVAGTGTDLSIGVRDANQMWVNSSTGDNVNLPIATASQAGIITKALYDLIIAGGSGDPDQTLSVNQSNISYLPLTISGSGNTVNLPAATTTLAGMMTGTQVKQTAGLAIDGNTTLKMSVSASTSAITFTDHTNSDFDFPDWAEPLAGLPTAGAFYGIITPTEPVGVGATHNNTVWFVY